MMTGYLGDAQASAEAFDADVVSVDLLHVQQSHSGRLDSVNGEQLADWLEGLGLAAPQVGEGVKVFCVDVSEHPKTRDHHGTFVLCNAKVVSGSRNEKAREGCMSVPDFTGDVKRPSRIVVRGQLPGTGEEVELEAEAFEARALQHEIDHCDGLLFLDRAAGAHAVYARKTYL